MISLTKMTKNRVQWSLPQIETIDIQPTLLNEIPVKFRAFWSTVKFLDLGRATLSLILTRFCSRVNTLYEILLALQAHCGVGAKKFPAVTLFRFLHITLFAIPRSYFERYFFLISLTHHSIFLVLPFFCLKVFCPAVTGRDVFLVVTANMKARPN